MQQNIPIIAIITTLTKGNVKQSNISFKFSLLPSFNFNINLLMINIIENIKLNDKLIIGII